MMAGAFLCHKTSARSRDGAGSRPRWLLTIDNARINPETHERWYLRVCTRLLFQNLRVLSSLRIQISCFWRPALGPLAFSSPRGSRAGSRSDTKPGSGAKPRADPRETRFLRLAPRTQSYARAKCCAALPSLAYRERDHQHPRAVSITSPPVHQRRSCIYLPPLDASFS